MTRAGQDREQRGFPDPVRPDQSNNAMSGNFERDIVQCDIPTIAMGKTCNRRNDVVPFAHGAASRFFGHAMEGSQRMNVTPGKPLLIESL